MKLTRTAISLVLAVQLAACGGGGSSSVPPIGGTPTPSPTPPSTACSLSARQDFADQVLNEWYLFPDLLASVNRSSVTNLDDYLDARVAQARAANRDRFFTFATSIAEENALINSGSSAGFGIRLSYDTVGRRVFVVEAYEGTAGFAAGLDRGSEITAIGTSSGTLQTVTSLFASGGAQAVADALGPSTAGTTRVLRFTQPGGAVIERSITKTDFAIDPVSDRYGAVVLTDGARKIGYLNLRTFVVANASDQMRAAFGQFAAQGVRELILDFRYNGGGLVNVADTLGDLMGAGRVGQVWSREELRPSKAAENSTRLFRTETNAIAPTRVAVITTGSSASASELVANSLIPYLGNNLALVGTNSFGKPVGQFGFDLAACDLRVRAVAFRTVNANGQGDYYTGLAQRDAQHLPRSRRYLPAAGRPARGFHRGGARFPRRAACTPISGGNSNSIAGSGTPEGQSGAVTIDLPEREMLQPKRPGPAQHEMPGLY